MARLTRAWLAAVLLAVSGPAAAADVTRWSAQIREASRRFAIPESWIRSVMIAESGGALMWRGRPITSPAGAMGLMQLEPATWTAMRRTYGLGTDPYDPRDNILAGTAYLRRMYDRFGYPGLFAAYNAGPGRYRSYLDGKGALPLETVRYVAQLTRGNAGRPIARVLEPASVAQAGGNVLFVAPLFGPSRSTPPAIQPASASPLFALGGDHADR